MESLLISKTLIIVWLSNDESKVLNAFLYYFYERQPWRISTGGTIARIYNEDIL